MSYPESIELVFWTMTFLFYFRGNYSVAGIFIGLEVITRPQGILIMPILALSLIIRALTTRTAGSLELGSFVMKALKLLAPGVITFCSWIAFSRALTGVAFAPYQYQQYYRSGVWMPPWIQIANLFTGGNFYITPDTFSWVAYGIPIAIILCGFAAMLYYNFKGEFRWELLIYSLVVFISLATDIGSVSRYVLVTGFSIVLIRLPSKWDKGLITFGSIFGVISIFMLVAGLDQYFRP